MASQSGFRVGLVLGAGGFVGGAWLTGALQALEDVTGWEPSSADHLVGTSAGSMIAAMIAGGAKASEVPGLFYGPGLEELRTQPELLARPRGATFRWQGGWPKPAIGSARLALDVIRHPRRVPAGVAMAAVLPRGFVSTEPIKEMVRQVVPEGWAPHSKLWLIACDLQTGNRVALGAEGAPEADLADAVAASCAIPGFYHPVTLDGRTFVDGGCWSTSNLDMLEGADLDLVVCFNPTSSVGAGNRWHERLRNMYRAAAARRLGNEARLVRQAGAEVALVQPTAEDVLAMGNNYMSVSNLDRVTEVARETVAAQLLEVHPEVVSRLRQRRPAHAPRREGLLTQLRSRFRRQSGPAGEAQPAA